MSRGRRSVELTIVSMIGVLEQDEKARPEDIRTEVCIRPRSAARLQFSITSSRQTYKEVAERHSLEQDGGWLSTCGGHNMLCGSPADVAQRQLQVAVFRNFDFEPSTSTAGPC